MSKPSAVVIFYILNRKFVSEKKIPPASQQVIYYSLSIGHHLGVIDCLEARLTWPLSTFHTWISHLPEDSLARQKLGGVERFGEIYIDGGHIHFLATALSHAASHMPEYLRTKTGSFIALLQAMINEPAVYLMIRKYND